MDTRAARPPGIATLPNSGIGEVAFPTEAPPPPAERPGVPATRKTACETLNPASGARDQPRFPPAEVPESTSAAFAEVFVPFKVAEPVNTNAWPAPASPPGEAEGAPTAKSAAPSPLASPIGATANPKRSPAPSP